VSGYERKDLDPRVIAGTVAALAVFVGLVIWLSGLWGHGGGSREPSRGWPVGVETQERTEPGAELARLRAEEDSRLRGYGWVDREHGIVRIPIERAMELLLSEGLPAREDGEEER